MKDAISRQAAQAKIKSICNEYGLSYEDGERKPSTGGSAYALGHAFDDLPPVTPQQRWIPVSEGLPEDRRAVLVTAYWHETYQVMMASYYGDGLWWCVPFNNCGEHMQRLKPKAWMPLPKPYKAEREE